MAGASVFFLSKEGEEVMLLEEETEYEEEIEHEEEIVDVDEEEKEELIDEEEKIMNEAEEAVMAFLSYMYIEGNYEKAANLYADYDTTKESKLENLEWTASSLGVGRLGYDVEKIEIVDREKISKSEIRFEFKLIRENGEAVPFGPCCGDFETPTWYTYSYFVNINNEDHSVYGDLLYMP